MPNLVIKISGLPKTGKTAMLANIASYLQGIGVGTIWADSELPSKPNAQVNFPGDKILPDTTAILVEEYEEAPAAEEPSGTTEILTPFED